MRANMKNKPLDYPREYVEFPLTTAEKATLQQVARENRKTVKAYVRDRLFDKNTGIVKTDIDTLIKSKKLKSAPIKSNIVM